MSRTLTALDPVMQYPIDLVCDSGYDLKTVCEADGGADGSCCGGRVGKESAFA